MKIVLPLFFLLAEENEWIEIKFVYIWNRCLCTPTNTDDVYSDDAEKYPKQKKYYKIREKTINHNIGQFLVCENESIHTVLYNYVWDRSKFQLFFFRFFYWPDWFPLLFGHCFFLSFSTISCSSTLIILIGNPQIFGKVHKRNMFFT